MSIDRISSADSARRLGADAQSERLDARLATGWAKAHDPAALVLDGEYGGGDLLFGASTVSGSTRFDVADPIWRPAFLADQGFAPLDNTKPHKTVAEAGDQLTRGGYHWNSAVGQSLNITYAFRQDAPATMPNGTSGFSQFTSAQIAAVKIELQAWSDVAAITFQQVVDSDQYTNNATILYGNYSTGAKGAAAFADYPDTPGDRSAAAGDGDVWVNITDTASNTPGRLTYGEQVLLHETGHALGLQHPGDYNASADYVATYAADATYYEDDLQYTVMSYFAETNTGANYAGRYAESPLMDDIAAMQKLYGANTTAFSGDTSYGFYATQGSDYRIYYDASAGDGKLVFCAYDTGGTDTFNFSGYGDNQVIDLNSGRDHFSNVGGLTGNVSIYTGTVIENALGGYGADLITGNDADNGLDGGEGADTLKGGEGNDTLDGGAGADNLNGGNGDDVLGIDKLDTVVTGGAGTDEAEINADTYGASSFSLSDGRLDGQIENIFAYGATGMQLDGTAVANRIRATEGNDLVKGLEANDTLIGRAGADTMYGGNGNDTVFGGSSTDPAFADGGDKIFGEDGADSLNGNLGNDTIDGGAGNDTIYGGANDADSLIGGAGDDTVDGGSGNDTIDGGDGRNRLIGGVGDDLIRVAAGSSYITGDAGIDELDLSFGDLVATVHQNGDGSGAVTWSGGLTTYYDTIETVGVTIGSSNYNLGTSGQIFYVTGDGSNTLAGGASLDILVVNYADDGSGFGSYNFSHDANGYSGSFNSPYHGIYFSGIDVFQLTFGAGGDRIDVGSATATINSGAGDDFISTGSGIVTIDAGALANGGFDGWSADLSATATAITLNLPAQTYSGPGQVSGIDYVGTFSSGSGADTIVTGSSFNSENISTNGGADTVTTVNGSDTIAMGAGSDTLIVNYAAETYGVGSYNFTGGSGGYAGSFSTPYSAVYFSGVEKFKLTLGSGSDDIRIGNALATINTGLGDDFIDSGTAIDTLDAGSGAAGGYDGWSANLSATSTAINLDLAAGTYTGSGSASGFDYVGTFLSGSGADKITTGSGYKSENISTGAGADTVTTVNGSDTVAMGAGSDTLIVNYAAETYGVGTYNFVSAADGYAGSFNDPYTTVYFSGVEVFQITTGSGSDDIRIGNALATITTGLGDDFIDSGTAIDTLSAGDGYDGWSADLSAQAAAITLDLTAGTYSGPGAASGFDYVGVFSSGSGADRITTGAGSRNETISTNGGADTVTTVNGGDTIHMGAGSDTLVVNYSAETYGVSANNIVNNGAAGYSGSFNDPYTSVTFDGVENIDITTGVGADAISIGDITATINTGAGADIINSGKAVDTIDGGADIDGWSADLSATATAMRLDLTTGAYTGPGRVTGIEYLGALSTGSKADLIKTAGGGHNEAITTNAGNDTVSTIDGNDTVAMGAGTDTLIVDLSVSGQGVTTYNVLGDAASGYAGEFDDTYGYNRVYFSGVEAFQFTGTAQGDNIGLGNAVATINTGAGDDFINSGTALDSLTAGSGTDGWSADLSAQTAAITLDLQAGTYSGPGTATGFEYLGVFSTGSSADLVKTSAGNHNETINTNGGNDTVSTIDGLDTVAMGAGSDTLVVDLSVSSQGVTTYNVVGDAASGYAGEFDDTYGYNRVYFSGVESFQFTGTTQADRIGLGDATATINTGDGDDFIDSGAGVDSLVAGAGTDGWSANLAAQTVSIALDLQAGTYSGPGSATGFEYLGVFSTGSGSDLIKTASGGRNESVITNDGADTVSTVDGSDTVAMGAGTDTLIVDLSVSGQGISTSNVVGSASAGYAGEFDDTYGYNRVYFSGVERFQFTGTSVSDIIGLGDAVATIDAGAGDDFVNSGKAIDSLIGGAGSDGWSADLSAQTIAISLDLAAGAYSGPGSVTGFEYLGVFATGSAADFIRTGSGAYSESISTNGGNDTVSTAAGVDTVALGGGSDTLIVDLSVSGQGISTANLSGSAGSGYSGEYDDAYGYNRVYFSGVETFKVTGSGSNDVLATGDNADTILGGAGADTLSGLGAGDSLDGGLGADSLVGGLGNDIYAVDDVGDVVVELAGEGRDTVQASVSYTLAGGTEVEVLTLSGSATAATGNEIANTLNGNALANTLDGGAGADTLVGGAGNDTYLVDSSADVVTEAAGGGTDTIRSSVTYSSAANVEFLVLTGSADINGTGDSSANTIAGNDGANSLGGGNGADTLGGGAGDDTLNGGLGADSLSGGFGDDTYIVDNLGDVVTEAASAGLDWVQSAVDFVLGANVENLTLTGSAVNGTGNTLANEIDGDSNANSLVGGSGADTLNGAIGNDTLDGGALSDTLNGGTGADSMIGGTGNDTFVVDNAADAVVELAGGGTDTVQSSVTYTLAANVENLTLAGNAAIDGSGNDLDNTLKGSSKDNVLEGGLGADTIVGGKGFDTASYAHASGGVSISLAAGAMNSGAAGADVISSVEALTGSNFADSLTGSSKGDVLDGGTGADTLVGGAGGDVLTGGGDADKFVFTALADSATKAPDRITDLGNADLIDLHLIDANTATSADDAFTLVASFSHKAGQLVLSYDSASGKTLLQGDTDGDGKANLVVTLDGAHIDFSNFAY